MATNYVSPKQTDIYFIVQNTSRQGKTIRIFGKTIAYGKTYDLLSLPAISEADIRESLVKGVLANRIRVGDVRISSSNIDLTQFSDSQKEFLINAGLTVGAAPLASSAVYSPATPGNWPLPTPTTVAAALDDVSLLPVAPISNLAAIAAVDSTAFPTGTTLRVNSLRCFFTLDKTSALVADGIIVIAAVGGGRWIRQAPVSPDVTWLNQTSWFIDPSAGNDENTGLTSGTAIKTWAELCRRVGQPWYISHDIDVQWLGDNAFSDQFVLDAFITGEGTLRIHGKRTILFNGITTAYAAHPVGTSTENKLTAGGGFTPTKGQNIHFTSGPANGAYCRIAKDLGGGVARVTDPLLGDPSLTPWPTSPVPTPAGGDTFEIIGYPTIQVANIQVRGTGAYPLDGNVQIYDLDLTDTAAFTAPFYCNCADGLYLWNASIDYSDFIGFTSIMNVWSKAGGGVDIGRCDIYGGLIESFFGMANSAAMSIVVAGITIQGGTLVISGNSFLEAWGGSIAAFDSTDPITLENRSGIRLRYSNEIYGSGNTSAGVFFGSSDCFVEWEAQRPTVAGSVGDIRIGSKYINWTQTPYYDPRTGTRLGHGSSSSSESDTYAVPTVVRTHGAITSTGANMFLLPNGTEQANTVPGTTVPIQGHVVTDNGVARNLRIHSDAVPGAGKTCSVVIWHVPIATGVPVLSGIAAILGAAEKDKSDVTNSLRVSPGDLLVVGHANAAGSAVANLSVGFEVS